MKLELKENMYIRTKDGIIDKILLVEYAEEKRQQYPNHPSKKYWRDKILLLKAGYWRTTQNIIKASNNIIDILEVGDYVNGNKVDFTNNNNKLSYEDKCIGFYDGDGDITLFENGIKSVITHEQMEQMAYNVEE